MTGDRRAAGDSLRGLALGDGFGVRWFHQGGGQRALEMIRARETPTEAPFHYTDETAMAIPRSSECPTPAISNSSASPLPQPSSPARATGVLSPASEALTDR